MTTKLIISILLMAFITYITRALPISIFNKTINNQYIKSFLYYVPYAVLASLTFPDIFYSTSGLLSAICGTAVAIILSYFNKSLVVVAMSSIVTVFLFELI